MRFALLPATTRSHQLVVAVILVLTLLAAGPVSVGVAEVSPLDWPNWQGPQQNHESVETGLIESWKAGGGEGSNLLWRRHDLGTRSTPVVFGDKLYVLTRDQPGTATEAEKVVCVDAATGETIWEHRLNVFLTEVPDTRVAWSSCTVDPETGRVYAQGVCGTFCCLEGDSGELVWSRSLHEELGLLSTYGGRTNIPVVFEDLVLVSAVVIGWGDTPEFGNLAKPSHRFMAFDKATGELRWLNGTSISPDDTTYSTPTVAVIGGVRQLVFGAGDGEVWGFQPRTGVHLWHYPFSRRGLNVSPLVVGDTVYMSHSEENMVGNTMGAVVAIDATQRGDLTDKDKWLAYEVMAGKSSPLMVDGKLWVVDDRAKLYVLDPETGRQVTKKALGTVMRSTPVYGDGKVYACTNTGRWYILKPNGNNIEFVHRLRLNGESNDGSPIISHGRVYLPTSAALYCLGTGAEPTSGPLPPTPEEKPVSENPDPAHLQLAPYDSLLAPGESIQLTPRLFNSDGQEVEIPEGARPEYSVVGPGDVSATGVYTAPNEVMHEGALVVCKVGELEGSARVRIVPPLPWTFDFNDSETVPLAWVGGRVRYVIRDVDGERAAVKRNVLPTPRDPNNKLGTRSQMWMGPTHLHDYTVQADVNLGEVNGKLPDAGIINSGYTMTIRSGNDELRVYSWSSNDHRTAASALFEPQSGVWYRMKLRVEQQDGKALVQGKMWPRDEGEPDAWTVEMIDESPVTSGSPGLFGNAGDAEFAVDNIEVTAND
ncbi:MAG: PQQ-binding-like beta-propeller repeat protein [Planctomycetales bacterium]|nr:PQQ-binding-like beta-propeller repeat protein [Planctomycetales bacterium]